MGETALVNKTGYIPGINTPVVKVSGFVKRYCKTEAVRGVELEINPRRIYGLIGPDGAGKSSLMKARGRGGYAHRRSGP